jgi:hypothetical protein
MEKTFQVGEKLTAGKVCQLINDGKINDLPIVYPHDTIIEYNQLNNISCNKIFENGSTTHITSVLIDSTHIL